MTKAVPTGPSPFDFYGYTRKGRFVAVEAKEESGALSPLQRLFRAEIERCRGIFLLVHRKGEKVTIARAGIGTEWACVPTVSAVADGIARMIQARGKTTSCATSQLSTSRASMMGQSVRSNSPTQQG